MSIAEIIFNPNAGHENGEITAKILKNKLKNDFDEIILSQTQKSGDAINFSKKATDDGIDSVFAIGGDGTVSEVVTGIMRSKNEKKPILGSIPSGTYNGVTRILNFPQNPLKAIKSLNLENTCKMDVGRLNDNAFNMIYSIGDVPEALHNTDEKAKSYFSRLAYAFNITRDALKNSSHNLSIKYDGKILNGNFSHVLVLLSSSLNKMNLTDEKFSMNDGNLHMYVLNESTLFEKRKLLPSYIENKIDKNELIFYSKAKEIEITCEEPYDLETDIDGNKSDILPSKISILPKFIEMYSMI